MSDEEMLTFTVEGRDGTDEFEVPEGLIAVLAEEDDESEAQVVADIAVMTFAGRAHAIAHHGDGNVSGDVDMEAIEEAANEEFEKRFGMSYGEATGHSH